MICCNQPNDEFKAKLLCCCCYLPFRGVRRVAESNSGPNNQSLRLKQKGEMSDLNDELAILQQTDLLDAEIADQTSAD